jgi:hypothetical protein
MTTFKVAKREDKTYEAYKYGQLWFAAEVFDDSFRGCIDSFKIGNRKGYKTERGAISAIKKAASLRFETLIAV